MPGLKGVQNLFGAAKILGPSYSVPRWRLTASALLQGVDWFAVTESALGPEVARTVHTSFQSIGETIEKGVRDEMGAVFAAQLKKAAQDYYAAKAAKDPPAAPPRPPAAQPNKSQGPKASASRPAPVVVVDLKAILAAQLLGVKVDATQTEIRAALRRHLGASGLHPDQGGDGEAARTFIDAKNLLIERARASGRS
jgi:hypothetical protein